VEALQGTLRAVAETLDSTGWAAELYDPEWRVVAYSREWRLLRGDPPEDELGYGLHAVQASMVPAITAGSTPDSRITWLRQNLPRMATSTPGGIQALVAMLTPELREAVGRVAPEPWAPMWSGVVEYVVERLPPARAQYVTTALAAPDGVAGWVTVYGPYAPATVTSLLMRGRLEHFARMASLLQPRRHEAAVLFADIQSSSKLSRHTSTAGWFALVRDFTTAMDDMVIDNGGVVGRHGGDGITAFFLADQLGTRGDACAAALRSGLRMASWTPGDDVPVRPATLSVNVGVHWGGVLYLGQVVSGGRLEVTALGDEVNECARIQETARDGAVLASKPLVERLWPEQAREFGIDPVGVSYTCLSELPTATEKAVRDAGGVPVVALH